ncbi:hypothetical protein FHW17_003094 [Phyllobacterium sp. P30BS-XVII]|nr:hypothetical protein [Phyllobacterium sp. P30BS-XVII]
MQLKVVNSLKPQEAVNEVANGPITITNQIVSHQILRARYPEPNSQAQNSDLETAQPKELGDSTIQRKSPIFRQGFSVLK